MVNAEVSQGKDGAPVNCDLSSPMDQILLNTL